MAACHDGQSVASGSSNGSIHVWRVEYTARAGGAPDRYTGIAALRQVRCALRSGMGVVSCYPRGAAGGTSRP